MGVYAFYTECKNKSKSAKSAADVATGVGEESVEGLGNAAEIGVGGGYGWGRAL